MVIGVDHHGTSSEGLSDLLDSVGVSGEIWINHSEDPYVAFHPKLFLFKADDSALLIVGSGNLTEGGLSTNDEAIVVNTLDLNAQDDRAVLADVDSALDGWCNADSETVGLLDREFLQELVDEDYVRSEKESRDDTEAEARESESISILGSEEPVARSQRLFGRGPRRRRPPRPNLSRRAETYEARLPSAIAEASTDRFSITALHGDLPQAGSSNELRITKGIRDKNPAFWAWPDGFIGPHGVTGQYHRDIRIRFGDQIITGYLKDFPAQKPDGTKASADFRLGAIAPIVQRLNEEDDMVILELASEEEADYDARVVLKSSGDEYEELAEGLIQHTRAKSSVTGTYKKYKYSTGAH